MANDWEVTNNERGSIARQPLMTPDVVEATDCVGWSRPRRMQRAKDDPRNAARIKRDVEGGMVAVKSRAKKKRKRRVVQSKNDAIPSPVPMTEKSTNQHEKGPKRKTNSKKKKRKEEDEAEEDEESLGLHDDDDDDDDGIDEEESCRNDDDENSDLGNEVQGSYYCLICNIAIDIASQG
jgi:hypothetical protein